MLACVGVVDGLVRCLEGELVLRRRQDVRDGAIRIRPERGRADTGGFEPVRPRASPSRMIPRQARSPVPDGAAGGGARPRSGRSPARSAPPSGSAGRGPFGVGSMRLGHVRGRGGRLAIVPAEMRGDPPPLRVDFDGRRRKPHLHQVMDELVRHAGEGDGRLGCGRRC